MNKWHQATCLFGDIAHLPCHICFSLNFTGICFAGSWADLSRACDYHGNLGTKFGCLPNHAWNLPQSVTVSTSRLPLKIGGENPKQSVSESIRLASFAKKEKKWPRRNFFAYRCRLVVEGSVHQQPNGKTTTLKIWSKTMSQPYECLNFNTFTVWDQNGTLTLES